MPPGSQLMTERRRFLPATFFVANRRRRGETHRRNTARLPRLLRKT